MREFSGDCMQRLLTHSSIEMKTVVFLLLLGVAFARGDATPDKSNQLENKNGHQVTKPSGLQTASTRNGDLQIAHMQYQANRLENQDMKYHQRSQLQNSQSFNQNQAAQIHNQDINQQFRSQSQAQFHSQSPAQTRQFLQNQNGAGSGNQEVSSLLQSQQRMTPIAISNIQSHANEQIQHDFDGQQVYSSQGYPEEGFYQDRNNMGTIQESINERRFDDFPQGQSQVISGVQSTMKTSGFPQVYSQRAAYDNKQQPIILPGVSQTHSTSVVVSGLKNLPVLPALVYSGAPVPSAHAVAYSRPWYQGGAYLKQHWQTPYARYVYSHIL